jgi:pSer/pThr/pTyr-binding forkhead associated (FHA) protein
VSTEPENDIKDDRTMHAKLSCKSGQLAGKVFHIGDEATIGSSPECTIHVRHGIISGRHVHFVQDRRKGIYTIEDLHSYNGTKLDGKPLRGKVKLGRRHTIVLANTFEFAFELTEDTGQELPYIEEGAEAASAAPTGAPKKREVLSDEDKMAKTIVLDYDDMFKEKAAPVQSFYLEFQTVKGGKQSIKLKEGENTIGRSSATDIVIDNPSISRQHAVLILNADRVTVKDAESRNGTFVNERRISTEVELTPDDEVRFGLVSGLIVKKS